LFSWSAAVWTFFAIFPPLKSGCQRWVCFPRASSFSFYKQLLIRHGYSLPLFLSSIWSVFSLLLLFLFKSQVILFDFHNSNLCCLSFFVLQPLPCLFTGFFIILRFFLTRRVLLPLLLFFFFWGLCVRHLTHYQSLFSEFL